MSRFAETSSYIITSKDNRAADDFREWARRHRVKYDIEGRRLYLYDHTALNKFQIFFSGDYDSITIWDNWQKRHLKFANENSYNTEDD